jgi:hypothetical protein
MRRPACETALRFLDSYIPRQPHGEADRLMLQHFDECPDCAAEFDRRNRLADRLRRAVESETVDPALAAKVRLNIDRYEMRRASPRSWGRQLLVFATVLILCGATWFSYERGHLRLTRGSQDAYIASISRQVPAVLSVGLRDHVHCTVFRGVPRQPDPPAKMMADLGPEYAALLPLVSSLVPNGYRMIMAHRCSYRGRKFVHLTLESAGALISLVIARKGAGEVFSRANLPPMLSESNIPIYQGEVQRFAVAGFETRDHLVYLVSDLGRQQNAALMATLAQPVGALLAHIEA